jgi:hypothetical protein
LYRERFGISIYDKLTSRNYVLFAERLKIMENLGAICRDMISIARSLWLEYLRSFPQHRNYDGCTEFPALYERNRRAYPDGIEELLREFRDHRWDVIKNHADCYEAGIIPKKEAICISIYQLIYLDGGITVCATLLTDYIQKERNSAWCAIAGCAALLLKLQEYIP